MPEADRPALTWRLTRLTGPTFAYCDDNDGCCYDGDEAIGRVRYEVHSPSEFKWKWSMFKVRPHADLRFQRSGSTATKEEGKQRVEEAYATLLALPAKR